MKRKIAFIFGTRPEIIKMSPIIRQCIKNKIPFFMVHTGQHYSHSMSDLFLEELKLPEPDYNLKIRSKAPHRQGEHTGKMMVKLDEILLKEMPSVVLVQGDTNSALAGALTASKISTTKAFTGFEIKVGHVEAGLRSYDRTMPEEINRVIIDHLSDYLFVPSVDAKKIVLSEGIKKEKIWVTGNTIVDAAYHARDLNANTRDKRRWTKGEGYILLTLHRQENVDDKIRLKKILQGVEQVSKKHKLTVIFPIHPRTMNKIEIFKIAMPRSVDIVKPKGFLDFIRLESRADLILTDSGGLQEEACALRIPCVTLRNSTERPETVDAGANMVAGIEPENIVRCADRMLSAKKNWGNPFGSGKAAIKILDILKKDNNI
ncbi:MAG: UDP-N-acetylglucosamine 2-epimerase (non-hydrolyzing) [Candidatus Omnitrophota bacterium]